MRIPLLLTAVTAAAAITLQASVPATWQTSGADFLKGDLEQLALDGTGRLTLAPASVVLHDPSLPVVWALAESADGSVYAGTGHEGHLLRLDPSGKPSVAWDAGALEIHAVVPAPGGGVYAASSPDGAVYRVQPGGTATKVFDPEDRYIWSLAVDRAGNLFVGTGDHGVIYKVTPSGASSVFYTAKATHVTSLAVGMDGQLLAGTESPARVIRLDANGKPFVLLETTQTEIHRLRVTDDGTVYALATTAKPGPASPGAKATTTPSAAAPAPAGGGTPTVTIEVTSVAVVADSGSASTTPAGSSDGGGAVYRLHPDGLWDLIWEARGDVPYDLLPEADGTLLVATGPKGRLYRLTGLPAEATLLTRQTAQHLTALLRTRTGQVIYATANPGRLLRLDRTAAPSGTYESDVHDAQTVATWGTVRWRASAPAGSRVEVATRSGNTKLPDETWSDWSAPYATPDGSAITSPRARYLQWRVALAGQTSPVLTSIAATYLTRNAAPKVTSLTIHPPGVVFQQPYPSGDPDLAGYPLDPPARRILTAGAREQTAVGKKAFEHGLLTIQWRADDEPGDDLEYDVLYRREGETAWKPLRQHLSETITVWDTATVPDGPYIVRVLASDRPSNAAATALTGRLDSTTIDVDNTPPAVTVTGTRRDGVRTLVSVDVVDAASAITAVESSLDGVRWTPIYALDGLTDSRRERYEVSVDEAAGARPVMIRAVDAAHNAATVTARPAAPAR